MMHTETGGAVPETTLPEQIENVVILAKAVQAETERGEKGRAIAQTVTKLDEALMWAQRYEDGGP